jgi:hypothetical protein
MPPIEPVAKKELSPTRFIDMERTVNYLDHEIKSTTDPKLNFYAYSEMYKNAGIDLEAEFKKRVVSKKLDGIKKNFLESKENGISARLAEMLPLLANKEGRLGEHIKARVSKTIRHDDQGNSFIDLVVEMSNDYTAQVDKDAPSKMIMFIDVTTNPEGAKIKQEYLDSMLDEAQKASVLCYKDKFGKLGIDPSTHRPKLIVLQREFYIDSVGEHFGTLINQTASDAFMIKNEDKFNQAY